MVGDRRQPIGPVKWSGELQPLSERRMHSLIMRKKQIVGVTAHFVSMHLDEGPIIAQDSFRVPPGLSLKQIVAAGQVLEGKTLVRALRLYLKRRLDVYWGVVKEV